MTKLSKEQSTILKARMQSILPSVLGHNISIEELAKGILENGAAFITDSIYGVIEQCTEKDFPELDMRWKDKDDNEHWINLSLEEDEIELRCDHKQYYIYFGKEQFKQFTDGVNKIMEYLNEK